MLGGSALPHVLVSAGTCAEVNNQSNRGNELPSHNIDVDLPIPPLRHCYRGEFFYRSTKRKIQATLPEEVEHTTTKVVFRPSEQSLTVVVGLLESKK